MWGRFQVAQQCTLLLFLTPRSRPHNWDILFNVRLKLELWILVYAFGGFCPLTVTYCCFKMLFALVRLDEREIRLIWKEKPSQTDFNVNERVVDPVWTEIFKRLKPYCFLWEGAHPEKRCLRVTSLLLIAFTSTLTNRLKCCLLTRLHAQRKITTSKQTIKSLVRTNIKAVRLVDWQEQDTLNLFDLLDN